MEVVAAETAAAEAVASVGTKIVANTKRLVEASLSFS
jgi:hypothetical protein